ncbi:phage nozzle protein [Brucella intermedia]|uniref:phage nozzle protein n=1 Tax=Brucella intermedia TaxID=94625 RepID=UPI00224B804E|nr:hypothetical protein [Brucella intermedia]
MGISSKVNSSLIQGVSQQAIISRGTASAEDQENCLNEVLDGVVSRMGSIPIMFGTESYSDPFVHRIVRDRTEQYVVIVENGNLRIINRITGQPATVTGSISGYLSSTGPARRAYKALTVGDTTFLLNRQRVVAMSSTVSPPRPNKGVAYFKAGSYSTTYTLTIRIGGSIYISSYKSPDNSSSGNADFIATNQLATQFRDNLVNVVFPQIVAAGQGSFSVSQYGSTLVITSTGGAFDLETSDGLGETQFIAFTDSVKGVTSLPAKCENGYVVTVSGNGDANSSKYYLKYVGSAQSGRWEEVVRPSTQTRLDASTMPHLIVNTGPNQFEVKQASWGSRLAGDGEFTAMNPSFVGSTIRDIQFISGRLAAISEYTATLSRARNAYVFFPDTVQTNLDTAPVDYDVTNGSTTAITHAVVASGRLQFWGDLQQTYMDTGEDTIKEDTVEALPLANYEFDGETPPVTAGLGSLIFGTSNGKWAKVTEVFFRAGRADGEIVITAHVPKLLPGRVRHTTVGGTANKVMVLTDGSPNRLFLYQYFNQGADRVQSAWNPWSFHAVNSILWADIFENTVYLLFKWPNGFTLEKIILDSIGDETDQKFPLRLDHRVSEASATFTGTRYALTLPYAVPEPKRRFFRAFERSDEADGLMRRGRELAVEWLTDTTLYVNSSTPSLKFFFGSVPEARRKDSRFYARDRNDEPVLHDRLLIHKVSVAHSESVEYDILVHKSDGTTDRHTYTGRVLGDPTLVNSDVPITTDIFTVPVNSEAEDAEIELVNSTPFPATWTAMKYVYDLTVRLG